MARQALHVMWISGYPYTLKFKYKFKIPHGVREHTDVVYVKLDHAGFIGWGEATLPPYLHEIQKSVIDFISAFCKSLPPDATEDWFQKLMKDNSNNMAAKAALDMALWDIRA